MQQFFARMSPIRAWHDLRLFLSTRQPHDFWFLIASITITTFLIWAFVHDSYAEKEYRPKITYFQQWRLDRTDAEIVAQQKIDKPIRDAQVAAQREREEKLRASFKRMDDQMTRLGL